MNRQLNRIQPIATLCLALLVSLLASAALATAPEWDILAAASGGALLVYHHITSDNRTARASQMGGIAFNPIASGGEATDMTAVEGLLDEIKDFMNPASPSQLYHDVEVGDNTAGGGAITTTVSDACHLSVHGYGAGGVSVQFADGTDVEAKPIDDGEVFDLPLLTNREVYPDVVIEVAATKKAKVFALSRDAAFDIEPFGSAGATVEFAIVGNNGSDAFDYELQFTDGGSTGIGTGTTFAEIISGQPFAGLILSIVSLDAQTVEFTYDPAVATANSLDMSMIGLTV